ncbi:DNA-binding transcriptional regulator, MurR/RpiR family, contains HTH and SIS domains [Halobacillus karajensis]|uniref:HTH-type transcriptional regulator YbbH n=1 Tax=Halobacillus karajensis TaxID=195088 RepID=A0A059NYH9_9BACI|nr:MurR/RpiR family transcriptional regulator [Halobacillus karajensis]CDQ18890.1 putative HTH-type transcriptional regulator YbbH [Halobacillus karajensis]CDQ23037.1 putative HTH-type transcriptional regulator YbbH [Halobacillus karajensis]CDQ26519.1 putative HTH-type transcriptional regulator YbbH [Halobacillus karajensis]SEH44732.1 DNA-binding transcriptional regulator, MurR/RpiR family, contains HTH and SIS domains [Halobacillus karajensis]
MIEPPTKHVISRIRSSYNQFSEKEKLIADYILENTEDIVHSTINQVADDLMVADATVFRFCKRIGFKGYQAMKIALASEIVNPIKDIHETISENDTDLEITEKVFQANIRALETSRDVQNPLSLQKAMKYLIEADRVFFFGSGGSNILAMDAQHKFIRTGMEAHAYPDTHLQLMSASQMRENDVAVVISHTGSNQDILDIVDVAKKNQVKTIAITNFAKSPLTKVVDLSLYTVAEETEFRSEALASRIAGLSLIDSLFVNYSVKMKEQAQAATQKMRDAISRKRV